MPIKFPRIIAHRGLSSVFPENTQAAFTACIENQVKAVEFDIQLSHDNVPVVMHDQDLIRVAKVARPVSQLDYPSLKQIDIGSWFSSKYSQQRILSYKKFLQLFAKDLVLFIEIKAYDFNVDKGINPSLKTLVNQTIELTLQFKDIDHFAILCFETDVLDYVHKIEPAIYTILNLSKSYSYHSFNHVNGINIDIDSLTSEHQQIAEQYNLDLYCYCCDSKEQFLKAKALGCDYYMSNRADWLQRLKLDS